VFGQNWGLLCFGQTADPEIWDPHEHYKLRVGKGGTSKALDRELPHGQTTKSSLRPQTPETMNSVQPQQRSTPTNGEQTKLRDEMRSVGQTITHEVALPYLRVSNSRASHPEVIPRSFPTPEMVLGLKKRNLARRNRNDYSNNISAPLSMNGLKTVQD
jgi:hypothetical protein